MPIELYVSEDRNIYIMNQPDISSSNTIGVTGENNATVLRFSFFEELNGKSVSDFRKRLVAIFPEGTLPYDLNGDFSLPGELTSSEELTLLVEILKDNEILFKTYPHTFTLIRSGDESETNLIQAAVDSTRENCRTELKISLETATGENHDNKTWDELNSTVAGLTVTSEEQFQALGDWDLIKEYFRDYANSSHHLFSISPKNTDGSNKLYRLPYIYTPKMTWPKDTLAFSTDLFEVGVDVSSAVNLSGGATYRTFSPLPKLERFVMTGNANASSLYNLMSTNFELRYIKMETPSEVVLKANPSYYKRTFYRCERLETIDCELDFTGQTDTLGMFTNCYKLNDLRIKPFTLATSLDLGGCQNLRNTKSDGTSFRNIITVLNAITNDIEVAKNMTITFSDMLLDFTTSSGTGYFDPWGCHVYWDSNTKMYTLEEPPYIEGGEASVETGLYSAFMSKGVTIEWK